MFLFLKIPGSTAFLNNLRSITWIKVQQYTSREIGVRLYQHLHGFVKILVDVNLRVHPNNFVILLYICVYALFCCLCPGCDGLLFLHRNTVLGVLLFSNCQLCKWFMFLVHLVY